MRVTMVGPFGMRTRGTMWRRAAPIARALARRDHQVTVVVPPWDSPRDAGRIWEDDGVRIVNTPIGHPARILGWMLWEVLDGHPDVVHIFKPKAYAGFVLQLLWHARQLGLWHGRLILDADDWEGSGGWNERLGYPAPARWLFAWQERWGFRHADALTVASKWLAAQAHALGAQRVAHVPNGVDPAMYSKRPSRAPDEPTALLLTRFVEFTPAQLVDIWSPVHARLPTARLIVAGDTTGDPGRIARRMMAAALPRAHVQWRGLVPFADIPSLCAQADVALFPAGAHRINRAKCPARLADVMAAGLAVVAARIGEHETYVRHGETGLLVPPGDDQALADAAIALLRDRPQAQRMGEAGRRRMMTRFTWERLVETVEDIYNGAKRRHQARPIALPDGEGIQER
ncbi:MAG: glycosyltransferase family 4 protein [Chloroflexi bacterium]|nr:glycosyltransferase family 4 protein [Chloroflexota bacterium]